MWGPVAAMTSLVSYNVLFFFFSTELRVLIFSYSPLFGVNSDFIALCSENHI